MIGQTGLHCCCAGSVGGSGVGPYICPIICCTATSEIVEVDLGAGGLSADDCTGAGCGNVAGLFDCDFRGSFPECTWRYDGPDWCPSTCYSADDYDLGIDVTIDDVTCKLQAIITLSIAQNELGCDRAGTATYRTAGAATCSGTETLSKVTEDWPDACTGTLPATITVRFV